MLEVGWSELLVIAIILIVVVGPKDLPGMMRTFGKMMGRVRTMANEFRGQFDEAMREAELDEVRKGLGEVNKYNPASSLRDAINPIRQLGQDIKADLQKAGDVSAKPKVDEGTPVAELSSDPVVDPEPAPVEPAPVATTPSKPALTTAATPAVVASEPVAEPGSKTKPAIAKATAETADAYPPSAKKAVRRKAAEPHVEHAVHVVASDAKPVGRARKKSAQAVVVPSTEPEPVTAKPASRKKAAKAGDA
ncbi:MAG: Sec-independent protein translocase protein TatB [Rhizobium sp.]|nr:Sec-independent protein translocase protein TatB [Rhizobium sp.]